MKKPEVEYIGGEPVRKMLPPTIFSRLFPRGVNAYGHRVKGEIEKIVATPQVFESYFGIDYRNDIHPAVGAILSQ